MSKKSILPDLINAMQKGKIEYEIEISVKRELNEPKT